MTVSTSEAEKEIDADYDFDVPEQLETILEDLLSALQDKVMHRTDRTTSVH